MSWCKECNMGLPDNLEKCPECGGVLYENPVAHKEDDPIDEIEWVVVAEKTGYVLGSLIKSRLESTGIHTIAKGSAFQAVQTYITPDTRILVPDKDYDEAKAIVDDMLASSESGLFCNMCGSSVQEEEDVCPSCGVNFKAEENEAPDELLRTVEWVTVAESTGEVFGKLLKATLENEGIPVTMIGSISDSVLVYETPDSKVRVPRRFFKQAKEIVEAMMDAANDLGRCEKCGAEISEEEDFCNKCGAKFDWGESSEAEEDNEE